MEKTLDYIRQLAKNSFGYDTVFIEKFIKDPRHIEYQIIGDKKNHLIHCYERECSVQRRHQKLIEETPSCALSPELREEQSYFSIKATEYMGLLVCNVLPEKPLSSLVKISC